MEVRELIAAIERLAPPEGAAAWDKSGVQIAGRRSDISRLGVMLDPVPGTIAAALDRGAEMLLTHHPLALKPRHLDRLDDYHRVAGLVLGSEAWLYAAHTSLDACPSGPAGWMGREFGLLDTTVLEPTYTPRLRGFRFAFDTSAWTALQALSVRHPSLSCTRNQSGDIELCCREEHWEGVKAALIGASPGIASFQPYEPALRSETSGFGAVGRLPVPLSRAAFERKLAGMLGLAHWTVCGGLPDTIARVAWCTGSGSSLAWQAARHGADVYVTGYVKYHQALEAPLAIIDVGHFILEEIMMRRFATLLAENASLAGVAVHFFPGADPLRIEASGLET